MMNEGETSKLHLSHSNVVPQISPKSPNRFGNAKVKFVSSEEATLLSRERPPLVRSRFVVPQPSKASSPSTTKHLSNLNCVSPSRSDTQVQALKRCADASHSQTKIEDRSYFAMQQRQVHPAYLLQAWSSHPIWSRYPLVGVTCKCKTWNYVLLQDMIRQRLMTTHILLWGKVNFIQHLLRMWNSFQI